MAAPRHLSSKILAHDLVAFTDAELDQYLSEHRLQGGQGGASVIDVEDPENLPQSFIQRLRDRARGASSATQSTPVDLGQVTSRLLDIFSRNDTSPQLPSPSYSRESSLETQPPIPTEVYQKAYWKALVDEGGRPLYSIDLIDEVAKDKWAHWDMLRPWLHYPHLRPDPGDYLDWSVLKEQFWDWQQFRRWQAHGRGKKPPYPIVDVDPDPEPELPPSRREEERLKKSIEEKYKRMGKPPPPFVPWEERKKREEEEARREWQDIVSREFKLFTRKFRRTSSTYMEAMRKLFAEYGFTRPFQLHEDVAQQDKLTTWIEYLGYQYAIHYRYKCVVTNLQPKYDEAWKTLVDADVLRPFETEEYVCNLESAIYEQSEEDRAEAAVRSAKSAAEALLKSRRKDITDPRGPRSTPEARARKMMAAKSRLEAAKATLKLIKRRNNLTTEFKIAARNYLIAKEDVERYRVRASWILEQIPLIEAELDESSKGRTGLDVVHGAKRSRGDEDNEATHDRSIKKQRGDVDGDGSPPERSRNEIAEELPSKWSKRGGQGLDSQKETADVEIGRPGGDESAVVKGKSGDRLLRNNNISPRAQSSATSKPLRRSARIAAHQKASRTPLMPSDIPKSSPKRTRRRIAPSAPPSTTGSQYQSRVLGARGVA